eukprot:ctg_4627.g666
MRVGSEGAIRASVTWAAINTVEAPECVHCGHPLASRAAAEHLEAVVRRRPLCQDREHWFCCCRGLP